jgi:hypothetical protein
MPESRSSTTLSIPRRSKRASGPMRAARTNSSVTISANATA